MSDSWCPRAWATLPRILLVFSLSLSHLSITSFAQPAQLQYEDCFTSSNTSLKFDISHVFAQVLEQSSGGRYMNLTVLGVTPEVIPASAEDGNTTHSYASE